VHLEIGVVGVGLAREQALELALAGLLAQALQRRLGLGEDRLVALGLRELDQAQRILELALDLAVALDAALEARALAQQRLRRRGLLPEVRVLDERIELG
jgi:hypothetical protein